MTAAKSKPKPKPTKVKAPKPTKKKVARIKSTGSIAVPPVTRGLVPAINLRHTTPPPPRLTEIDQLVHDVLSNAPDWVLIDRIKTLPGKDTQSSSRYILLRRRGFEVAVRHVDGVKNFWARWPHGDPGPLPVPTYDGDEALGFGGVDRIR